MTAPAQTNATSPADASDARPTALRRWPVVAAIAIVILAAVIRTTAQSGFKDVGFDEALYRNYILLIEKRGFTSYPSISRTYIDDQRKEGSMAKLPPTRFMYIFSGWAAKRLSFGDSQQAGSHKQTAAGRDSTLDALHRVSLIFSILSVGLCGVAAWRMAGPAVGLGVMALLAFSPLPIHMGKHALVDGFFAFWATLCLWLLWENLRHPNSVRWLIALALALALMVMTKENAFFVYVAMVATVVINRWAKFGVVTKRLVVAGILGPGLGLTTLIILAGGLSSFVDIYRLLVAKAQVLEYAKATGDGPWFRYLLELILIDPIGFILAMSAVFTLPRANRAFGYLIAFVVFSYVIMCNVRYGMNLRYTTIWALPFAALAVAQVMNLTQRFGRYARPVAGLVVAGICAFNFSQYQVLFGKSPIYEPVPAATLQAVKILKFAPEKPAEL